MAVHQLLPAYHLLSRSFGSIYVLRSFTLHTHSHSKKKKKKRAKIHGKKNKSHFVSWFEVLEREIVKCRFTESPSERREKPAIPPPLKQHWRSSSQCSFLSLPAKAPAWLLVSSLIIPHFVFSISVVIFLNFTFYLVNLMVLWSKLFFFEVCLKYNFIFYFK